MKTGEILKKIILGIKRDFSNKHLQLQVWKIYSGIRVLRKQPLYPEKEDLKLSWEQALNTPREDGSIWHHWIANLVKEARACVCVWTANQSLTFRWGLAFSSSKGN